MAWTIKRIEADYFMGYRRLDLDLTRYRGITSIEGQRASPGTSNGASKSSLLEAIHWCSRGKLIRKNKKADKVMHRWMPPGARTVVRMTIDVDGQEFMVERTRTKSGSALRAHMQGKPADADSTIEGVQELVDRTLGFHDDRTLTSTTIFSGSMAQFCSMTDAERKAALERMIGADHFAAASAAATAAAVELERQAVTADGEAAHADQLHNAAIAERHRAITTVIGRSLLLRRREEDLLADVELASVKCSAAFDALQVYHEGAVEAARAAEVERGKWSKERDVALERIEEQRLEVNKADQEMAVAKANIRSLRAEITGAQSGTHADKCPTCGQRWPHDEDPAHLKKRLADLADQIRAQEDSMASPQARRDRAQQNITEADQRRRKADAMIASLSEAVSNQKERELLTTALGREATLNAAIAALAAHQVTMPDPEFGELSTECPEIDARIEQHLAQAQACRERAQDLRTEAQRMQFWKKGFGRQGMPSYLLDSSIPGMNEVVGQIANILSNGELTVSFDPAAAKGSGEVFAVNVEYANGGDDYDMTSTGEHVRVDLAVMFAMRDLVERRGGNRCTQLFLDEVFHGTDAAFAEACMNMLRTHYKGRDIFIISHDDAVKSLCDNTIVVEKRGREAVVRG